MVFYMYVIVNLFDVKVSNKFLFLDVVYDYSYEIMRRKGWLGIFLLYSNNNDEWII